MAGFLRQEQREIRGFPLPDFRHILPKIQEEQHVLGDAMKGNFQSGIALLCLIPFAASAVPGLDPSSEVLLGAAPSALSVADFNGDGDADIVVATSTTLAVYFGDGSGGVTEPPVVTMPVATFHVIAIGDFDGDSNMDVAGIHEDSDNVSVLFGQGDGNFTGAISLVAQAGPEDLAAFDLNNDGADDLVVANAGADSLTIFLSNHDGTFGAGDHIAAGDFPAVLQVVDGNVVVLNAVDGTLQVFSNSAGVLTVSSTVPASSIAGTGGAAFPAALASTDLNTDGFNDVVVGNLASNELYVLYGDALGNFGNGDVLTSDWHSAAVEIDADASAYLVDGIARLPKALAFGDVTGDTIDDLVVAAPGRKALLVFPGNGVDGFEAMQVFETEKNLNALAVLDLDASGTADAAGLAADSFQLFVNNDPGNRAPVVFSHVIELAECSRTQHTLAYDVDGDETGFDTVSITSDHPLAFHEFLPQLDVEIFDTGDATSLSVATFEYSVNDGSASSRTGTLEIVVEGNGNPDDCIAGEGLTIVSLSALDSITIISTNSISGANVQLGTINGNVSLDGGGSICSADGGIDSDYADDSASGTITINSGSLTVGDVPDGDVPQVGAPITIGSNFCGSITVESGAVISIGGILVVSPGSVSVTGDGSGDSEDDAAPAEDEDATAASGKEPGDESTATESGGGAWFWLGLPLLLISRRRA